MEYTQNSKENGIYEIKLNGKFTFSDHIEFKKLLTKLSDGNVKELHLNFEALEFIDSAGLGILLLAKDDADKNSKKLVLYKPQGQVQKMFKISNFYELFNIVD